MSNATHTVLGFYFQTAHYFVPLLLGASAFFLFHFLYPKMDEMISHKTGGYLDWMLLHLDRLFIKTNKHSCWIALIFSTSVVGLIGFIATIGLGILNFMVSMMALYTGWVLPRLIITVLWRRRLKRFDILLIDALDLMANSIKSGLNLLQIIQVVVKEMPNPLSQEFQLLLNQHHLGVSIEDALQNMMNRIPSEDLSVVINAILILRETGGNLGETFTVIASTIRERRKVEGKIRAFREQALFQAIFLFCMPFGIAIVISIVNPGYLDPLFTNKWGWGMVSLILGMQLAGGLWLKKLVTIDV